MTMKERLHDEYRSACRKYHSLEQEEKANPGLGRKVAIAYEKEKWLEVMVAIKRIAGINGWKKFTEIEVEVADEYLAMAQEEELGW